MSSLIPPSRYFPPASIAPDDGLLAAGGDLAPEIIVDALIHGIFPWSAPIITPNDEGSEISVDDQNGDNTFFFNALSPASQKASWNGYGFSSLKSLRQIRETLCWWSPDPRAIFELETLHIPSRLRRTMRSSRFQVTFDQAFPEVVLGCALAERRKEEGTWITKEFFCGYCLLFEQGLAHSVECWTDFQGKNRRLVGGVYGVAINSFFDGESMFSVETDASKVALFTLLNHLKERNFQLFDLQILNSHTKSLGGIEISRNEYLSRLKRAVLTPATF